MVVGTSLAGLRACESLRAAGFAGTITAISDELHPPYDRPPLSKALLKGDWEPERIQLRKPAELAALDLDLRLGVRAEALDTNRCVTLATGERVVGDGVIVATGSAPRRLPDQPNLDGVVTLRTLDDSLDLRRRLAGQPRVVVIGAGFIGLEVAATAAQRGCSVVVVEALGAPLIRGLGAEMGALVAGVHGRNGVDVRCNVHVAGIEGSHGRVVGVQLADGELIAADVVVVGIGVAPTIGWLAGSGLALGDGVLCEPTLAAAPRVFAAGDCARWVNPLFGVDGEEMRVEHWTNAAEQGALAATNLLAELRGEPLEAYAPVPFFWSDQFDARIQFLGRAHGDDEVRIVAGDPPGRFVALYGHEDRLRGVLGVSWPKRVMPYRRLLADRATWGDALDFAERQMTQS